MKKHNPTTIWPVPGAFQKIYSHAVEFSGPGDLLFVSGQIGIDPNGQLLETFANQCQQAMSNVEAVLEDADFSTDGLVRLTYFLTDPDHLAELNRIRMERWSASEPPAVTTLVVAGLARKELLVEIEATVARYRR